MTDKRRKKPSRNAEQKELKPGLAARLCAQRLLTAIVDARTPMDALTDDEHGHPTYLALDYRDRALVRAILMAALRHRGDLSAIVSTMLDKPLPAGAQSLSALLHVALAQILLLDVPAHSAADLAVEAANQDPRNRRFAALVNALCRRAVRSETNIREKLEAAPVAAPDWFIQRLATVYGAEAAQQMDRMHRQMAPIDISLKDRSPENIAAYCEALDAIDLGGGSLRLRKRAEVTALPGFDLGDWWVQDASAAIPARLCKGQSGKVIADLCAAPGGKTAQLAASGAKVVAVEKSASRAKRLKENLTRLQLIENVEIIVGDLFDLDVARQFDAVLLDAPCSSTGTVRRHPDVPWTKDMDAVEKLAALQARMLDKAAKHVKPGGLLVFSNCSLDPLEGEEVALAFAVGTEQFQPEAVLSAEVPGFQSAIDSKGNVRTTPCDLMLADGPELSGADGFFAARFVKVS